jgi:hypothetical protein
VGEGEEIPVVGMGEELGVRVSDRDPEGDPEKDGVVVEEVDTLRVGEGVEKSVVGMEEEEGVNVTVVDTVTLCVSEDKPVVGRAVEDKEKEEDGEELGVSLPLGLGLTDCPAIDKKQKKKKKMLHDLNSAVPVKGMVAERGGPRTGQKKRSVVIQNQFSNADP